MKMSHNALEVADWFVAWNEDEFPLVFITPDKMNALLYYTQGHHLGIYGTPLFDSPIEAGVDGLVVPSVRFTLETVHSSPVVELSNEDFDFNIFSEEDNQFLIEVWEVYGNRTYHELISQIRQEGPWMEAARTESRTVTLSSMGDYFQPLERDTIIVPSLSL